MIVDPVILGRMAAELKEAVAEIRARADEAQRDSLKAAFSAIKDGDKAGRDLSCEKAANVPQITRDAILEAGLKIGEKYGFSREMILTILKHKGAI